MHLIHGIINVPWKDPEKNRAAKRDAYRADPAKHLAAQRQTRIRRRQRVLNHYGTICQCCGEDRYEFLAIDHIDGGGTQHRKSIGENLDRWLVRNKFPDGYRVLCHNCNSAIGFYGYCPHKTESGVSVCIPALGAGGAGFDSQDSDDE